MAPTFYGLVIVHRAPSCFWVLCLAPCRQFLLKTGSQSHEALSHKDAHLYHCRRLTPLGPMLPSQLLACTWEQLSVSVTCGPLPAVARSSRTVSHAQRCASYNELHHGGPSKQFNVLIYLARAQWCKTCFIALPRFNRLRDFLGRGSLCRGGSWISELG